MSNLSLQLTTKEKEELHLAKTLLENPGIAMKITNVLGSPIQQGMGFLPKNWNEKLSEITTNALLKAADTAIFTLKKEHKNKASQNLLHKISAGATGAMGGVFGIAGLAIELPITTTIILRSVADIARSNGESINEIETKLACLEVFALGGDKVDESTLESGYYATRTFLSNSMSQATKYVTEQGIINEGAPIFLNIISKIAKKFGVQVTEKTIAQSVPIIGAAGGAVINTVFISHFQDMAQGHFIIRKLERKYNQGTIKALYHKI
ncbi:EcsC family protein [Tenacibaculum sp. 190524A05c]|uniref:EcsC family protein n=1 Tax=Tenacibaculum platacis TaxID=3137852 RepID=A0ABM9P5I4_9FLAO